MSKVLTKKDRVVLLEMRRMGCTFVTIGEAIGVTDTRVLQICKQAGVRPRVSSVPKPVCIFRRGPRMKKRLAPFSEVYPHSYESLDRLMAGR